MNAINSTGFDKIVIVWKQYYKFERKKSFEIYSSQEECAEETKNSFYINVMIILSNLKFNNNYTVSMAKLFITINVDVLPLYRVGPPTTTRVTPARVSRITPGNSG